MEIPRKIEEKLRQWKLDPERKPLLLQGARQVGKTWLLKEFGKKEFKDIAYFNFEEQTELKQFFEGTKEVGRILQNLSLVHGREVMEQQTLLVFDEIQECNAALNSLKYFCENAPNYAVAGAGSLLGVAMSRGNGFPVGKVNFMEVHPIDFSEFLAVNDPKLAAYLGDFDQITPLPDIFFNQLVDKLKMYFISGGMPEAVVALQEKGVEKTQQVLQEILNAYTLDFSKYADNREMPKINHIWGSIPSQLARENKKFVYRKIRSGARAREYEDALMWLSQAGLIYRIFRCEKPALPLSAYDDMTAFKTYLLDTGLLRRLSRLDPVAVKEGDRLFTEFKGALTENFVLQHLVAGFETLPRYWSSGNKAEIDFLLQLENSIIPIEVKSDKNIKSRSLALYNQKFNPPIRVRYSLKNLEYKDGLLNIPLFMAGHTKKLLDLAKKQA
jgi:predicted AAA+ superfamily ATPase